MIKVGNICYKDYSCNILISKEIKDLLEKIGIDKNLAKRFPNEEYFFENFLFSKEELKEHKSFEIIYFNEYPEIDKEIAIKGKMTMTDIENNPEINWIVLKD